MSGRWIVACACLAVAGCGSEPRLEPGTAGALSEDVAAVRAAAREGDRDGALGGLDSLHAAIEQAEADGELDERDAVELRRGVRRAKRRVDQELAAAPPPPAATPEPTATPEPPPAAMPAPPGKKPKPAKPGKGPGHGGDDEDGDEEGDD